MPVRVVICAVAIVANHDGLASAQSYDQFRKWCYHEATENQTIEGCDAVIASKRESRGDHLVIAFDNRGFAKVSKGMVPSRILAQPSG
jgi:hypothetical protein